MKRFIDWNRKFTKNAIDIRYLCLSISLSKHYNVVSRCIQETLVAFSLLLSFLFYRWLLFSLWLFTLFASTFMDCFTPWCGVAHTFEACFECSFKSFLYGTRYQLEFKTFIFWLFNITYIKLKKIGSCRLELFLGLCFCIDFEI